MKYRALPRVVAVHLALIEERDAIIERLAAINKVFGISDAIPAGKDLTPPRQPRTIHAAPPTEPLLIRLVLDFTQDGPKPIVEVLRHLRAKKFKFKSQSPLSELLAAVEKSYALKDYGGKLGPSVPN